MTNPQTQAQPQSMVVKINGATFRIASDSPLSSEMLNPNMISTCSRKEGITPSLVRWKSLLGKLKATRDETYLDAIATKSDEDARRYIRAKGLYDFAMREFTSCLDSSQREKEFSYTTRQGVALA